MYAIRSYYAKKVNDVIHIGEHGTTFGGETMINKAILVGVIYG